MTPTVKDHRIDLLRVIAISLIVLMHSPLPDCAPGYVLSSISYLTAPGLVLFFMISGALLLGTDISVKDFFKRRFSKVLWPTLFWTVFYLILKFIEKPTTIEGALKQVLSIPFSAQGHGVLWFMYTLAGLYLMTPILSRWLQKASKQEVGFYLALWGITLIYPYLKRVLFINETDTGILFYFAGYVGYYVLGFYLRKHYVFRWLHVIVAFLLAVIIPIVIYGSGITFDFYSMLWYLSLPVASMAFCWYVLICKLPNKRIGWVDMASKLSFGIYFIHVIFIVYVFSQLGIITGLPGVIQIFAIAISSFVASLAVSWLISRLPFSKYIIGS